MSTTTPVEGGPSKPVYIMNDALPITSSGGITVSGSMIISSSLPAGSDIIGGATDAGPSWTSSFGVSGAAVVSSNATGGVDVTDAPTTGEKLVITDIVVSADTAMSVLFEEETSGKDIFKVFLPASGTAQITTRSKVKLATANKKLRATASVSGNIAITVCYYSEE